MTSPPPFTALGLFFALSFPTSAGEPKVALPSSGDWEWTLSAGPSLRNVGTLRTTAGYRSGGAAIPSFAGGDVFTAPPVGDPGTPADREYDDGYVRQDATTAVDGLTWYWGYENGVNDGVGQVQGGQLVYSATGFQSIYREGYSIPAGGPNQRDSLRGFSPHIQLDGRGPGEIAGFRVGFSSGFDFTQVDHSLRFSNFAGRQNRDDYRLDYTDRYDLAGIIPPLAPYMGSFGGPGPIIGNLPSNRQIDPVLISGDGATIFNNVRSSIDIDVFSFTVGPSLSRTYGPFAVAVQAGLILNIYDWETRQTESLNAASAGGVIPFARWDEGDSGTKFRPGVYLQGDVSYDVGNNFAIGGFVRLDTARDFSAQAGPTSFEIDPSGYSAGFMLRWQLP